MPSQPTARDLHVDVLLTQVSLAYRNKSYIADEMFPLVKVQKQSNRIPKYDQSPWFRDLAGYRAPGTKSKGGGFTVDTSDTYFCDRYSFRMEVSDEERDNADQPFDLDRDATVFVTDKIQMRREVAFAGAFFTTSVWGADKVGGTDFTQWSDYAGSSPLVDVTNYIDDVEQRIVETPNVLAIGKQVWVQLKWHPDLIDTIKYTQKGMVSQELAASLLDVPKLLIGRALQTTSVEGTAEASVTYTRVWGKHALLMFVPAAPSLLTPAAGYTFSWERVPGAIQYIKRMRDEEREVDIFESNTYFAQKATASRAGDFLQNAVA